MSEQIKAMIQKLISGNDEEAAEQLKAVLAAKAKEKIFGTVAEGCGCKPGYYVTDANDKNVAGPFKNEGDCDKEVAKRGGDEKGFTKTYISDYDARRMNEGTSRTVSDERKKELKELGYYVEDMGKEYGKEFKGRYRWMSEKNPDDFQDGEESYDKEEPWYLCDRFEKRKSK